MLAEILTPDEAALFLRVNASTLKYWRTQGVGPPYIALSNNRVRYHLDDLDQWLLDRTEVPAV